MTHHRCRHFLGMFPDPRPQCAKGRNVRAWAMRCNGSSTHGIGLRLPCTKQSEDGVKPLFDCPEVDRRTDEEVEAIRAGMSRAMDRLIHALPALSAVKADMVLAKETSRTINCPMCDEPGAMSVSVAIGVNDHMAAKCDACGEGFIE